MYVEKRVAGTVILVARADNFPSEIQEGEVVNALIHSVKPVDEARDVLPAGYGIVHEVEM